MKEQKSIRVFTGKQIGEALQRMGRISREIRIQRERDGIRRTEQYGLSEEARHFRITF